MPNTAVKLPIADQRLRHPFFTAASGTAWVPFAGDANAGLRQIKLSTLFLKRSGGFILPDQLHVYNADSLIMPFFALRCAMCRLHCRTDERLKNQGLFLGIGQSLRWVF
jgi:hypothetical protein